MCDNQNFESLNMTQVTGNDIKNLLDYFSKTTYGAKTEDLEANTALHRCIKLMELDYNLIIVSNNNGDLSAHYPSSLVIPEYENNQNLNVSNPTVPPAQRTTNTIYESIYDVAKLRDMFNRAKFARCRARFPGPVILYRGKHICRSATLSGGPEIYGRSGLDYLFPSGDPTTLDPQDEMDNAADSETSSTQSDWQLFDRVRNQDIKLLKILNVGTIVDLMVEKKKVKFGMNVTSSEKVDKENRYSDFNIMSLPYPGCEFFKDFRDNNFNGEGLVFDWTQEQCDATVSVPDSPLLAQLKIDWNNYKTWDLIIMTQNYIKYLLKYLQDNSSGILIHCISGWDRTPLFISLLRMSLWAEGLAHQGLDEHQIIYLTIAYDWMLFGHRLPDRIDKGEEIFFFCFYMLKYLTSDDFCIAPSRHKMKKHSEKVVEENVNRTDSDPQLELLLEHDSRGSNISLNSTCSTVSSKSQEPTVWYHHGDEPNGCTSSSNPPHLLDVKEVGLNSSSSTSPQARRTSPVTVPVSTRLKRTESSMTNSSSHSTQSNHSNNSSGSWQVVTWTGSLRSSDSTSGSGDIPFSQSSMCTVIDGDEWSQDLMIPPPCRKDRLLKVREVFYSHYFKSMGCKIRFGPEPTISAIFGNIAEKVGLSQRNN